MPGTLLPTEFTVSPALWTGTPWRHDKVRIAYLSADFHQHATAFLMAELFEAHDRSHFEIIGVSFGVDDGSDVRRRLVGVRPVRRLRGERD